MNAEAERFLAGSPAAGVLRGLKEIYPDLPPLMIVGATCRDALHAAHGNPGRLRYSDDIDIALAVDGWEHYQGLISRLTRIESSTSGIRYRVGPMPVGPMPFGPNRRAKLVSDWKVQPDDATLAANLHNSYLRNWPPLRHPLLLTYAQAIRQAL